jgi:hypothetical protein
MSGNAVLARHLAGERDAHLSWMARGRARKGR